MSKEPTDDEHIHIAIPYRQRRMDMASLMFAGALFGLAGGETARSYLGIGSGDGCDTALISEYARTAAEQSERAARIAETALDEAANALNVKGQQGDENLNLQNWYFELKRDKLDRSEHQRTLDNHRQEIAILKDRLQVLESKLR